MKTKIKILLTSLFVTTSIFARDLTSSASYLGQEATKIALALGVFGLVLSGIYFMLGKQDASTKVTNSLLGIVIVVLAPSVVIFAKNMA